MPTFEFTSPEGKTYEVQGPEGSTKAQAFEILQQRLGGEKPSGPAVPDARGFAGVPSMIGEIASKSAANLVDIARGAAAGTVSMPGELSKSAQAAANWANAKMGGSPAFFSGKTALPEFEPTVQRIPRLGLPETAQQKGFEEMGSVVAPMPGKALAEGVMQVPKVAGKAAKALTPALNPELVSLAQKATERGIPLRPDMLMDNKIAKFVGSALEEKVPFSGGKADVRQQAFNRAVADSVGLPELPSGRLTYTEYGKAIDNLKGKFEKLHPETVPYDVELQQKLSKVLNDPKFQTESAKNLIAARIKELSDVASRNNNIIDGKSFQAIQQDIGSQVRGMNPNTQGIERQALDEIEEAMLDSVRGGLDTANKLEFDNTRRQYAYAKIIEPLIAKKGGVTGNISPQGLSTQMALNQRRAAMARGKAGDLGELARIGQAFIKEPHEALTKGEMAGYGAVAPGVLAAPGTTAATIGAANIYNRLAPGMTRALIAPPIP